MTIYSLDIFLSQFWTSCDGSYFVCSVAQSCPTLCDPMDYGLPGSSVHGIFPGKNTGVFAVSSSKGSSRPRDWTHVSCIVKVKVESLSSVQLFATPWTVTHQAPLSMGILQARILEWVAMPFSRGSSQPRDQTQVSHIASRYFTTWATREAQEYTSG